MLARNVRGRTSPVFLVVLVLALLAIVTGGASTGIAAPQTNTTPSATTATVAQQHQGASVAGSGEYYYYYQGNRIPLRPAPNRFVVKFRAGVTIAQAQSSFEQQGLRETETIDRRSLYLVEAKQSGLSVMGLARSPEIEYATPVLLAPDDGDIVILNEFLVKFKPTASEDDVRRLNALYKAEIIERHRLSGIDLLRVPWNSSFTGLDSANAYYESGVVEFATPNWIEWASLNFAPPNDTFFDRQWSLQAPTSTSGGIDAVGAWDIEQGSSGVVVAVLDTGVDVSHEDLVDRLVPGYDAITGSSDPRPGSYRGNAHGTLVAGVVAAVRNNEKGIAGIAPGARVMPVRVMEVLGECTGREEPNWIVRGIEHAVAHGAAVINMSFITQRAEAIEQVIIAAVRDGRGGKGTLVVAASGNNNYDQLGFPASDPRVLAVGATDRGDDRAGPDDWPGRGCDGRLQGSNYGQNLGLVAPGVGIWSTDISGSAGYSTTDYFEGFGGTSGAAPMVAAAAALVMSRNPGLSQWEVQRTLEESADKVAPYQYDANGWNREVGYGRLNVRKALLRAAPPRNKPVLVAPANERTTSTLRPIFSWSSLPDAEWYNLYVTSGSTTVILKSVAGTSYTPDADLSPNRDYRWEVTPWNGAGPGPVSDAWTFRTPDVSHGVCNNAAFVRDVTFPDGTVVQPGQAIDKAWEVRNTGDCTWSTSYRLAFDGGDQMGARDYVNIPQETRPGQSVIIHVPMTAPSSGTPRGYWKMADPSGGKFGDRMWVQVIVTPNECMAIVSMDYPALMRGNQDFVPKIRIRLLTGDLRESRGDMLACYDADRPQEPGCKQHSDWRYGAWEFVPVQGTVAAGQEYTFDFSDTFPGNKMTAPGSDGTYTSPWRIWRRNPGGSWAFCGPQVDIRFTVDASGPSVSLRQPPDGAYINSNAAIELFADASDNSGVKHVTFQYNDGSWHDISTDGDGGDGWRATWNPAGVSDRRDLQLRARAEDRVGNTGEATNQVTLDRTPPSTAVTALAPRQARASFPVTWSGNDGDNGSGVQLYQVQYRNGTGSWMDWYTGSGTSGAFNGELGRTYCFRSSAIDRAGNVEPYPGGDGDTCTQVPTISAEFAAQPASGTVPLDVTFTDLSRGTGITAWTWDFGDGTPPVTGVGPHKHIYQNRGSYMATLTIASATDSSTAQQQINVYVRVVADFTATPSRGVPPLTVAFTNRSTGDYTSLTWDFGDPAHPAPSHEANPTHRYESVGVYTVTLQASGPGGTDSKSMAITVAYEGDMVGHVPLQGRPAPPHSRWSVPLVVTLARDQDAPTVSAVQTDANGSFTVTHLIPGSYQVLVKHAHSLGRKAAFNILGGDTVPVELPTLWEGDASDSNAVEQGDVNILSASYNRAQGAVGYDERADFNVDEYVGIADLSLLASNFGRTGDTAAPGATGAGNTLHIYLPMAVTGGDAWQIAGAAGLEVGGDKAPQPPANIALSSPSRIVPGAIFSLDIRGDSGERAVDAAEVHLAFDPALLEVVGVTPYLPWATPVLNEYDNAAGVLAYAAGNFSGKAVEGSFVLATVHFRARAEGRATLSFLAKPVRGETALYGGGARLPLSLSGGEKTVNVEQPVEQRGVRTPGHQSLLPGALRPAATAATTVTLEFVSEPAVVPVGRLAQVSLYVDAGAQPVDAVDIYVNFDPRKIRITDASGTAASEIYRDASVMPLSPLLNRVDNAAGQIDFAAGVAGGSATDRFRVGYFYVYALSPGGLADLGLNHSGQRSSSAYLLGFPVSIVLRDISIPVEVPEPATLLLLGSGIAGLAAYARRRRQKR